jgi:hypothetical protein
VPPCHRGGSAPQGESACSTCKRHLADGGQGQPLAAGLGTALHLSSAKAGRPGCVLRLHRGRAASSRLELSRGDQPPAWRGDGCAALGGVWVLVAASAGTLMAATVMDYITAEGGAIVPAAEARITRVGSGRGLAAAAGVDGGGRGAGFRERGRVRGNRRAKGKEQACKAAGQEC